MNELHLEPGALAEGGLALPNPEIMSKVMVTVYMRHGAK